MKAFGDWPERTYPLAEQPRIWERQPDEIERWVPRFRRQRPPVCRAHAVMRDILCGAAGAGWVAVPHLASDWTLVIPMGIVTAGSFMFALCLRRDGCESQHFR